MIKYINRIFTARSKIALHSIVEESRKDNTLTATEKLGNPENSKKYNVLCKLSETVNTDEYMEEFKKNIA